MAKPPRLQVKRRPREVGLIALIAFLQVLCAAVFVEDLVATVFGLRSAPVSWTWRETIEITAGVGLILGVALAAMTVRNALRDRQRAVETLRAASGEFHQLVVDQFEAWGLTPSEKEVALFMLKGFANSEIAKLRNTSEGTIKAQATAVFRKAGVTGRPQLLSAFIEELMAHEPDDSTGREKGKGA